MKLLKNKKAILALKIMLAIIAIACWAIAIKHAMGGIERFGARFFTEVYSIFAVTIGFDSILLFLVLAATVLLARKIFKNEAPPLLGKVITALGACFFIIVAVERALKVGKRFSWDNSYFIGKTLLNDSIVFVALILLLAVMAVLNREKISIIIKSVIVFLVTIYLADFLVFNYFMTRLYFSDVKTMTDTTGAWSVFRLMMCDPLCRNHIYAGSVIGVLFILYGKPMDFLKSRLFFVGTAIFFTIIFLRPKVAFTYEWVVKNFAQVYIGTTYQNNYSESFIENNNKKKDSLEWKRARVISEKPRNIIFINIESLSNWQSGFFSGIRNVTPNVDRIAKENLAFKNFYANSYKTTGGLLAIMEGKVLITPTATPQKIYEFRGYYGEDDTLPSVLKRAGYHTEFLTTGDLAFTDKGNWLTSIGFDFVEGHTNPLYDSYPRSSFQSVRDEALYKRALSRLYEENLKEPFFLFLETVSTHEPFTDPMTGAPSTVEHAMVYADEQLGLFYDEIKRRGFLENGIIVIVGDHRSKTDPLDEEVLLYGESFLARVPLVIGGAGFPKGEVEGKPFQQTDILPSFASKFGGVSFSSPFLGNFLGPERVSPKYIIHGRGDDRSLASVYCSEGNALVKLDGDDTYILEGRLEDEDLVLDTINNERIVHSYSDVPAYAGVYQDD